MIQPKGKTNMGSKLRPLYDKLYIKVETVMLARQAIRENKKYARTVAPLPTLDEDYRSIVRGYWKPFRVSVPKKLSFRLFANADKGLDERVDPRYIPDELWFDRIIPHYNNLIFAKALQDKCLLNLLFPDVRRPVTVVKRVAGVFYDDELHLITRAEAASRVHGHGRVIIKPSVSTGKGHNILFFDSDNTSAAEAEALFDRYGDNFIIQEKLEQHETLARLNPSSVNTIRILTFLHNDEVHVLSACLRVGGSASEVDNTSQGGFVYTLGPDGRPAGRRYSHAGGRWSYAEVGEDGFTVPGFERAVKLVCEQAGRMGHFRILGWDISVSPDGEPVFIEFNVIPGQNQEHDGPTFGDMTDEVLAEVFGRRNGRREGEGAI